MLPVEINTPVSLLSDRSCLILPALVFYFPQNISEKQPQQFSQILISQSPNKKFDLGNDCQVLTI